MITILYYYKRVGSSNLSTKIEQYTNFNFHYVCNFDYFMTFLFRVTNSFYML